MRVDLKKSRRRPLPLRAAMRILEGIIGAPPGPLLAVTYAPEFIPSRLRGFIFRSMHGGGPWDRGESELIATFVSDLNTCHF